MSAIPPGDPADPPATPRAPLAAIFLTILIDMIGIGIMMPLVPMYAKRFGANGFVLGLLMASYALMQFFLSPIWGRLSDRIGRRPVLLGSIAVTMVGMLAFGLARSLPLLFLARMVAGVGAANLGTARAYIADVTAPEDRAKGMGLVGVGLGLGMVLGPFLGGALADFGGLSAPGLFGAGLSLVNLVLVWAVLPESRRAVGGSRPAFLSLAPMRTAFAHRDIKVVSGLFALYNFGLVGLSQAFVLFLTARYRLTSAELGYTFAFSGVVVVVVQRFLVGRLSKRLGDAKLLQVALLLLTVGMALFPLAPVFPIVLLGIACNSTGGALLGTAVPSLTSRIAPPEAMGGTLGLQEAVGGLARVVGPAFAGLAYDRISIEAPFWIGAGMMLGGVAFARKLGARRAS